MSTKELVEDAQKNRTILVVEDERPLQNAIKLKLEKHDFEVVTARSVKQALEYLHEIQELAAVWLDHYLLGDEDGLVFLAKLKSDNGKWQQLPVFVVSNTASDNKVKAYLHLGVSNYYVKAENRLDAIISDIEKCLDDPDHCKISTESVTL